MSRIRRRDRGTCVRHRLPGRAAAGRRAPAGPRRDAASPADDHETECLEAGLPVLLLLDHASGVVGPVLAGAVGLADAAVLPEEVDTGDEPPRGVDDPRLRLRRGQAGAAMVRADRDSSTDSRRPSTSGRARRAECAYGHEACSSSTRATWFRLSPSRRDVCAYRAASAIGTDSRGSRCLRQSASVRARVVTGSPATAVTCLAGSGATSRRSSGLYLVLRPSPAGVVVHTVSRSWWETGSPCSTAALTWLTRGRRVHRASAARPEPGGGGARAARTAPTARPDRKLLGRGVASGRSRGAAPPGCG